MENTILDSITDSARKALLGLLDRARLEKGQIVVVGCSTSEIQGEKIGTASNLEIARAIMQGILPPLKERGLFLATQCCQHLNRALVVERECARLYCLETVLVLPVMNAGGALAVVAMDLFDNPVVIESIQAHAGLDIGDTLIGMHLRRVAIPVRLEAKSIGQAHLTAAYSRPKLIGGARAAYPPLADAKDRGSFSS